MLLVTLATASASQCPIVEPTPPPTCSGSWIPVSVVGHGTHCTLGPEVCAAQQFAACPQAHEDLPFGSKCVQLETNVYGCVAKTSCSDGELEDGEVDDPPTKESSTKCENGCQIDTSVPEVCSGGSNGWTPISVVDAGTFCVKGTDVCVAESQSACPGPQRGLPFGSSCVRISTGVYGCVENQQCQLSCGDEDGDACETASDKPTPAPTTGSGEILLYPTKAPTPTDTPMVTSRTLDPTTATPVLTIPTPTASTEAPVPTSVPATEDPDANASLLPVPNPDDTFTIGDRVRRLRF